MWFFIFGSLILAAVLGNIYLVSRFARFSIIYKAAKGRKIVRYIIGAVLVILLFFSTWAGLGPINAMLTIIHLMVIWLLCDGINGIVKRRRKIHSEKYYAGAFALGITAVYLICGWYLAHHVWRTEYVLTTDKPVGSLCVVLISDSHVGTTFDGKGFAEHIKAIQAENPDIVVVAGDFVDDDTTKDDMIAACEALGTLQTTYGVYYAFGNHDKGYYGPEFRGYSGDDLIAELERNYVVVLQDEAVLLDNRFYLIGRQDRSEEQRGDSRASMAELVSNLDPDKYSIVLDHQPSDYAAQTAAGVDLVLSGHTHGGQLFPINYMGQWTGIDDKTYGLEKRESTNFIVTSGISDWAIKFKTGCKSEYVVINVLPAEVGQ
ncbi:MAG: metallophosphoesterase [Acetatifactor sp.]|nr:metallophosphoesterase [Acetatifactor sp.]